MQLSSKAKWILTIAALVILAAGAAGGCGVLANQSATEKKAGDASKKQYNQQQKKDPTYQTATVGLEVVDVSCPAIDKYGSWTAHSCTTRSIPSCTVTYMVSAGVNIPIIGKKIKVPMDAACQSHTDWVSTIPSRKLFTSTTSTLAAPWKVGDSVTTSSGQTGTVTYVSCPGTDGFGTWDDHGCLLRSKTKLPCVGNAALADGTLVDIAGDTSCDTHTNIGHSFTKKSLHSDTSSTLGLPSIKLGSTVTKQVYWKTIDPDTVTIGSPPTPSFPNGGGKDLSAIFLGLIAAGLLAAAVWVGVKQKPSRSGVVSQ